ncbi:MAG TPA: ATP-binding protein [Candidatus Binatia bacterium]|nr:ATP-binding protein [Candidatus Binatia bacterium]
MEQRPSGPAANAGRPATGPGGPVEPSSAGPIGDATAGATGPAAGPPGAGPPLEGPPAAGPADPAAGSVEPLAPPPADGAEPQPPTRPADGLLQSLRTTAASLATRVGRLAAEPLDRRFRDALAWSVLVVAASLGTIAVVGGRFEPGLRLATMAAQPDGQPLVIITDVEPWSEAARQGLQAGMIVVEVNGLELLTIPGLTEGTEPKGAPISLPDDEAIWTVAATWPWSLDDLRAGRGGFVLGVNFTEGRDRLQSSGYVVILGLVLGLAAWWWLSTGRAGDRLRGLAWPTASALAGPLALFPLQATGSGAGYALTALVLPATVVPLADGLSAIIDEPSRRRPIRYASAGATVVAVLAGLLVLAGFDRWATVGQWLAVGYAAALPGLATARSVSAGVMSGGSPSSGRIVEAIEVPALGLTPVFAALPLAVPGSAFIGPLLLWVGALLAAQRFTVRPLARLATRTALQRDLIVAATEAERARIATDIHDDVLQELTLLVHRLDAAGAVEAATAARGIAERLRAITSELRLPVLDDLGVGAALEWLVARVERLAGGEVRLERDDGARLPPEVELAFFRVAQEALANAVKHGRPPIVVRFRTSETGATLTVDDSGPGIPAGAAEAARIGGHLGLLGMEQRAEQIGAILDVRRWPGGGTHVGLEWRSRSA